MNYFWIADSGSTKTDWALIAAGRGLITRFRTAGMNPYFLSENEILHILREVKERTEALPEVRGSLSGIYFYGSDCSVDKIPAMYSALCSQFSLFCSDSRIEVYSDLLGAARALCGKDPGIACILGTGSNSCMYDGHHIVDQVPSLGYILGDEGSGAVLGKIFVGDLLKNQLPEDLKQQFLDRYNLTPGEIVDRIYRHPFPNRFLAGFSPFIRDNMDLPPVQKLVKETFVSFFQRNILQYGPEWRSCEIHFTGSVAYYYGEILREIASKMNLRMGNITCSPLDGLIHYHEQILLR